MRVQEGLEREGLYMYLQLIHGVLQQKLTQHCKAVILQFKKKEQKNKNKEGRGHEGSFWNPLPSEPLCSSPPSCPHPPSRPPAWASELPSTPAPVALDMLIFPSAYFIIKLAQGSPSCSLVSETWAETVLCSFSVLCGWQVSHHEGIKSPALTEALSGWRAKALMSVMGFWGHKALKLESEENLTWASGFVCCCFQSRRRSCQGWGSWRCRLEGWVDPCLWMRLKLGWQHSLDFRGELKYSFFKKIFIYLAAPGLGANGLFNCSMWDLVPWPGINPGPLHWEHVVLATGPPGKSPQFK